MKEMEDMRITISFKKHEKNLYYYLRQFSSPAAIIKDILKKEIETKGKADGHN